MSKKLSLSFILFYFSMSNLFSKESTRDILESIKLITLSMEYSTPVWSPDDSEILMTNRVYFYIKNETINNNKIPGAGYNLTSSVIDEKPGVIQSPRFINRQKNIIQSNWKTFINERLGFTFQYPPTWVRKDKDVEVVDLSGTINLIEINFVDTTSQATLLLKYHLGSKGIEHYRYTISQYDSSKGRYAKGKKNIVVAGKKAIQSVGTMSIDGRGNLLSSPLKLIVVNFLDKKQSGEIELQFKTQIASENSDVIKFNQLISSFKFIN